MDKRKSKPKKSKSKKGAFSKIIVSLVIALNVIFTLAVLILFSETSTEPSSLIVAWFSFTTVELWSLAGIKKAKEKKENDYE
jgi:hypothetical protein